MQQVLNFLARIPIGLYVIVVLVVGPLVFRVARGIGKRRRAGRATCGGCGYELTTIVDGRCPECGKDLLMVGVHGRLGRQDP